MIKELKPGDKVYCEDIFNGWSGVFTIIPRDDTNNLGYWVEGIEGRTFFFYWEEMRKVTKLDIALK